MDMAMMWTLLNSIRLFFNVPFSEVNEGEERFLQRWRALPAERRQLALDTPIPVKTEADREAEERAARIAKMRAVLNGGGGA